MPSNNAQPVRFSIPSRIVARWGEMWLAVFSLVGGVSWLAWDVSVWIWRAAVRRRIRLGRTAIITQMVRVGWRSIGIVLLVSACIGFILALQMEPPLADFGQTDKIANIVGVAVFRELGPLIAAIVLTGFAGASIAAEIGTMVVGEEIEALEAHALNPVRFLVVPRVIATTVSLILLTVLGDVTAVFAGGVMAVGFLDVPYELYKTNTLNAITSTDFVTGLAKAGVFGTLLGCIACHNGLKVTGGAAGVGRATTDTVVQTVVWVIIADLIFTMLFYTLELG
ncbi:MAG: ABC transporter permease [Phycisphaeraceae bacterium]|nr:MAG: ABC transporter permease [Phycisphaeraceae bacterium]